MLGIAVYLQIVNRWLVPDADPVMMPVALVLALLCTLIVPRLRPLPPFSCERSVVPRSARTVLPVSVPPV